MTKTVGTFATSKGSKYLQQLCKHFAHKVEATWSETEGRVALPTGDALLTADPQSLIVTMDVAEADHLARAHSVIDSHLERFAFREEFKTMDWVTTD